MNFTPDQVNALRMFAVFLKTPEARVGRLTGYAGTGKTTIIKWIRQICDNQQIPVVVLAPTGRAALRVREATNGPAHTIHKWLYSPHTDMQTGETLFGPRPIAEFEDHRDGVVLIDEASMVGRRVWNHLLAVANALNIRILLVGDPFQLEPVDRGDGDEAVFCPLNLETPHHAHLSEVVRQALDSPVLRAATMVRAARDSMDVARALGELSPLTGKKPAELAAENPAMPVIVHRNATRHEINNQVRRLLGRGEDPEAGEPLLVLKNCYALDRYNGEVVELGTFEGPAATIAVKDRRSDVVMALRYRYASVGADFGATLAVLCLDEIAGATAGKLNEFWIDAGARDAWRKGMLSRAVADKRPPTLNANYGYAITAHKAQGSEFNEVLTIIEPSIDASSISGRRWIYTSLTRAKKLARWCYL